MIEDNPAGLAAERVRGYLVVSVTIAARLAEVAAAKRRDAAQAATRQSEERYRQVMAQQRSDAGQLRHDLRNVARPDWWDKASPSQIGTAFADARSYRHIDPELDSIAVYMWEQIQERYGIDAEQLAREAEQRQATGTTEAFGYVAEAAAVEAVFDPEWEALTAENVTGPALAMQAEGAPSRQELEWERAWDDPVRRAALEERMARLLPDHEEAAAARLAADVTQGRPAAEAVRSPSASPTRIIRPAQAPGRTIGR